MAVACDYDNRGVETVGPTTCRCAFRDWTGLRHALGLTQTQFGTLLSLSHHRIHYLEVTGPNHSCHTAQTLLILRYELQDPIYIAALAMANYPHPFPEDISK